jgi:hypothetical protein
VDNRFFDLQALAMRVQKTALLVEMDVRAVPVEALVVLGLAL